MDLGAFSVSLAVKDIEASKLFYEKLGVRRLRRRSIAELADREEWRPRHRAVSGDVREEHSHLQPGLDQRRSATQRIHGRSRVAAPAQGPWRHHDFGSRRKLFRPGQLHDRGSGRKHDSGGSTRVDKLAGGDSVCERRRSTGCGKGLAAFPGQPQRWACPEYPVRGALDRRKYANPCRPAR